MTDKEEQTEISEIVDKKKGKKEKIKISEAFDKKKGKYIYAIKPKYNNYIENKYPWFNNLITKDKYEKNRDCNRYVCSICGGDCILRAGNIKNWHWAHKVGSRCPDKEGIIIGETDECDNINYEFKSNESADHYSAKHRLHRWLCEGRLITVLGSKCTDCDNTLDQYNLEYKHDDTLHIEYHCTYHKIIPDVAIVNNGVVRVIFEIYHTNKSKNNRPEPWFEINAFEIINKDLIEGEVILLRNIRYYHCGKCCVRDCSKKIIIHRLECPDNSNYHEKYVNKKFKMYNGV